MDLLGVGSENLTLGQIVLRTVIVYFCGIGLVQIGKSRLLGKMTAFDIVVAIILGSLLSRAVTDQHDIREILVATLALVSLHWLFSYLSSRSDRFGSIIKGTSRCLVRDGVLDEDALKASHLSKQDFLQMLRLNAHAEDLSRIKSARMERNGDVSFVFHDRLPEVESQAPVNR